MDCPICGEGFGHKAGCPNAEPIPEKFCICELCDDFIYVGDRYIDFEGVKYHTDCFIDEYEHEA